MMCMCRYLRWVRLRGIRLSVSEVYKLSKRGDFIPVGQLLTNHYAHAHDAQAFLDIPHAGSLPVSSRV